VDEIAVAGTIDDLVADAAQAGHGVTIRLIRDWTEAGLLDHPRKQSAGKGHGSRQALYTANQRMLFRTLLDKRPGNGIRSLTRIPVGIWMYWGDEHVPLRQARRAFKTWLGDARASKQRARWTARDVLLTLDNPAATEQSRRRLVHVLTEAAYTGKPDFELLESAVRAVFEPNSVRVRRAIGPALAQLTTESVVEVLRARLTAADLVISGNLPDSAFIDARQAHAISLAGYRALLPTIEVSGAAAGLYATPTLQSLMDNCCVDLLTVIGTRASPGGSHRDRDIGPRL
jgi:hypothetical protein